MMTYNLDAYMPLDIVFNGGNQNPSVNRRKQ